MSGVCRISEEPEKGVPEFTCVNIEHLISDLFIYCIKPEDAWEQITERNLHNKTPLGGYGWSKSYCLDMCTRVHVCVYQGVGLGAPTICQLIATASLFLSYLSYMPI